MSALDLKISINQLLDRTDDPEVLALVYALLKKMTTFYDTADIIGYEADGTPITERELIQSIIESTESVKNGNFVTHHDMKLMLGL
jgi:hypothetical protein